MKDYYLKVKHPHLKIRKTGELVKKLNHIQKCTQLIYQFLITLLRFLIDTPSTKR